MTKKKKKDDGKTPEEETGGSIGAKAVNWGIRQKNEGHGRKKRNLPLRIVR